MANSVDDLADFLNDAAEQVSDMTRSVPGGSVGSILLDRQAQRIADRAAEQKGTAGKWPKNKGKYGLDKRKAGLPVGVGLKSSEEAMLSLEQIRGEQDVSGDTASMSPGTSEEANKKAGWFEVGSQGGDSEPSGAKGQVARPWFGLTDSDADDILIDYSELIADVFGQQ